MKLLAASCLLAALLLVAPDCRAQTVLQGDSSYLGFRMFKDSMATVVARLGHHYHRIELFSRYHAHYRNGTFETGTRVHGYAMHYRKLKAAFCVDNNQKALLYQIRFYPRAAIASTRGIRPGAATFADVIARYGPSQRYNNPGHPGEEPTTQPKVYQYSTDRKVWYTMLRYGHVAFVRKGRPAPGENLMARKVQEIWLW